MDKKKGRVLIVLILQKGIFIHLRVKSIKKTIIIVN